MRFEAGLPIRVIPIWGSGTPGPRPPALSLSLSGSLGAGPARPPAARGRAYSHIRARVVVITARVLRVVSTHFATLLRPHWAGGNTAGAAANSHCHVCVAADTGKALAPRRVSGRANFAPAWRSQSHAWTRESTTSTGRRERGWWRCWTSFRTSLRRCGPLAMS